VLAAIDLGVFTPGFFHISASLFDNVIHIKPPLQMSAAELALFVLLVAGTLVELLDLDFVLGALRNLCYSAGRGGQNLTSLQD